METLNPWRFDFDTDPDFDLDLDLDDVDPLTLFSAWALLPPIEIGIGIGIGIEIDIRTSIDQWSFLDAVSSSAQSTKHKIGTRNVGSWESHDPNLYRLPGGTPFGLRYSSFFLAIAMAKLRLALTQTASQRSLV